MSPIPGRIEQFRDWLRTPPHDLTEGQRTIRWWVDLARHCAAELRHDRASQMAAALTYHTLFSLVPTAVLVLVVLQSFVGDVERQEFKQTVVNWVLSPIQAEAITGLPGSAANGGSRARTEVENQRRVEFEKMRGTLTERVESIMDTLERVDFRSIGLAGLLLFLYGATGLLSTIERSFNTVYGAATGRRAHVRFPIYYTVLTVGPIVVIGSQILRRSFIQTLEQEQVFTWALGGLAVLMPFLAAWLVLFLMYMLLPNTRVSIRMAAVGSFIGSILWMAGIQLFSLYVRHAAIATLYGALALVPLFLFWMWIAWQIVLFGLELTYTLQAMREGRFRHGYERARGQVMVDRTLLLPLATRIAIRFEHGELATVPDLSRDMSLPDRVIQRMLGALVDAGLVHVVKGGKTSGFSLARPASEITASQILLASEGLLPTPLDQVRDVAVWAYLDRIQDEVRDRSGSVSLEELSRAAT